ncbi:MAG: hypothetical protein M1420_00885 [Actinobacteria bacterium]|jgi:hypothetical protein|nr:hypothetical protein [Actinomycetota bacterium]
MIDAMDIAITWTALGILTAMSVSFLLFIPSKIDKLGSDLTARIDQVNSGLTARIDQVNSGLTARIDQLVKDVGELKGDMKIVKDRLGLPVSA